MRTWSENSLINCSEQFEHDVKSLDWSSNGNFIAVGSAKGKVYTVSSEDLHTLSSHSSCMASKKHCWIEDIKVSPDNSKICFGTHGGLAKIEIASVNSDGTNLKKYATINVAMSSAFTHCDWTVGSDSLIVNDASPDVFFVNTDTKEGVGASSAKDFQYHTFTCLFGFPVQGIFPGVDFTDVNSTSRNSTEKLIASAEDTGMVKLFKYPCTEERASSKEYAGHSSHVTKVRFSSGDNYVVSTGGNDKSVLLW